MALTRKQLKGLGLSDEQIEAIMEGHIETVDGLKDRVKQLEADAQKVADLEQQLADAKKGDGDWKARHDAIKQELDALKSDIAGKEALANVKSAFKTLLDEEKIDPKKHDLILRKTSFDGMKIGEDGKLENADKLRAEIREDWADYIQSSGAKGAGVPTPPGNGGSRPTKEEILKIEDAAERQRAIAENHDLFGF